jgi:hypothetical protein
LQTGRRSWDAIDSWKAGLDEFQLIREQYLLYADFTPPIDNR